MGYDFLSIIITSFLDEDECQDQKHNCDVNAQCNNTLGSYNCTCLSGYSIFRLLKEIDQELHWYTLKQRNSSKFMLVPMIL